MGIWMVGGTLGFTVGPVIVVTAVKLLGLEGTPWLMIGGWLASAILFLRLRHLPPPPSMIGEERSWRTGLHALRPLLVPLVGLIVMRALMVAATWIFLPTFLTERGANFSLAGVSVSIAAGAGIIGSLLGGSMSDRWGRRRVLFISTLLAPILMFILLQVSGWALFPVLIGLGIVMPPAQVIMMAIVQENCPENRALANSLYLSLAFISESTGALVLGVLGDLFGLHLAYAASAVILLLSLPLILLLPQEAPVSLDGAGPR
jgi:FSR family fosmidomycin resistance protein-like MFS transporter